MFTRSPQVNREWNHSQGPGEAPLARKFLRPEVMIRVKCNIHSWMRAFIGVVANPYFAVSGTDGTFEIPNVPPGDYVVEAWHETLGDAGTENQRRSIGQGRNQFHVQRRIVHDPFEIPALHPFAWLPCSPAARARRRLSRPRKPPLSAESTAPRIYVTNEVSGDMTVIDSGTNNVIATVPLGKRPRGIHASPDGKTIYVALSGSPIAGPGVDESTLPPPDKSADGIGVFDVAQNKIVRVIKGGSDPENFDISKDGKQLFISNEDDAAVSSVDIASGSSGQIGQSG